MSNKKEKSPFDRGGRRTPYPINWDEVDKFLMAGASGVQIASVIGITYETLYERCVKEKKKPWSEYSLEKKQKGNSMLLGKQYQIAMKGNVTMLVWLGKQRLGQREKFLDDNENIVQSLTDLKKAVLDGTLLKLLSNETNE